MLAIISVAATCAFPLWQTPTGAAIAEPPVRLTPLKLSRLTLPVYGTEHLITFGREESETILPVLLRYREGELIEELDDELRQGRRPAPAAAAVGVECAARSRLFEAISGERTAPWDLLKLGDGCACFSEAVLNAPWQRWVQC